MSKKKIIPSPDVYALKLHVSKGVVWQLDRDLQNPECTGMSIEALLDDHDLINPDRFIRVAGCRANIPLLARLYELKQEGEIAKVEVCSPMVCRVAKHRKDPYAILHRMRLFKRASSLGGFHEVTDLDYRSYRLAAHLAAGRKYEQETLDLLRDHPAWTPIAFVESLRKVPVATLLATIIDPRWYVDETSPNSVARLNEFLGLTPRTQSGVFGIKTPGRHHHRCQNVLNCWKNPRFESEIADRFDLAPPQPIFGSELPGFAPYDFIWRAWGDHQNMGNPNLEPGDPVKAELRASQRFIMFLWLTWLNELYRDKDSMPDCGASLFRPADFFKHEIEVQAYEVYQINTGLI